MLPPLPPTEPDVQISSFRFFTGELRSRQRSEGQSFLSITLRMTPSVTRLARKVRRWGCDIESKYFFDVEIDDPTQSTSVDRATPRFDLGSSAIRCRFVHRFVRPKVLPCCPSAVLSSRRPPSLGWVPVSPVPQRRQYYEGATTSHPRIPGHLFVSLPGPTRSLSASCSLLPALPGGWRLRSGQDHCSTGGPICRLALAWT